MAIEWGDKDPDEVIKYAVDFAEALAEGDTLATVVYSFIDQAGLTKANEAISGTLARVTLSAGTHGLNGKLRCFVTTTGGEQLEEVAKVKVRNKT